MQVGVFFLNTVYFHWRDVPTLPCASSSRIRSVI